MVADDRMSSPSASVLAFTPRGHPMLGAWRAALSAHLPVRGVSGATGADLRRWLVGLAPRDPLPPETLPLAPWGAPWRRWHARWLLRAGAPRTVVFTRPDQAPMLADFAAVSRVVYFAKDDYATYGRDWDAAETQLLAAARHVVCVSRALAQAVAQRHPAAAAKTIVLPNAIPTSWLPPAPPAQPTALPAEIAHLPRPLAGVLGRISSRLRLDWLLETIERDPSLHWVFVGDIERAELAPEDRPRLTALQQHPRCTFLGPRDFAELRAFAAALDIAVLPYSARSTNPNGSAVRLFFHLPFAAPLLATPGCAQVDEFVPFVRRCDSAAGLSQALRELRAQNFDDGHREARWRLAQENTWAARARQWLPLVS